MRKHPQLQIYSPLMERMTDPVEIATQARHMLAMGSNPAIVRQEYDKRMAFFQNRTDFIWRRSSKNAEDRKQRRFFKDYARHLGWLGVQLAEKMEELTPPAILGLPRPSPFA